MLELGRRRPDKAWRDALAAALKGGSPERIELALRRAEAEREERILVLRRMVSSGSYRVDSELLARAILDIDLGGKGEADDD